MKRSQHRSQAGFTLVEIMIVVAIIGLLAALAVPGFIRSRNRSIAERCMNDCRVIDHAIDQWAIETGAKQGDGLSMNITAYVKGNNFPWVDPLGNSYIFWSVGATQVSINPWTTAQLRDLNIDWGNYNNFGSLVN